MLTLKKFMNNDSGATAIEYSLIAALMAAAIISALGTFSTDLKTSFSSIGSTLKSKTSK